MSGILYGRERGKKEDGIFREGKVGKLRFERGGISLRRLCTCAVCFIGEFVLSRFVKITAHATLSLIWINYGFVVCQLAFNILQK